MKIRIQHRTTYHYAEPVRLGSHRSLFVEPGFDTSHLRALVMALESVS